VSLETEILERRVGQTLRGKWTLERLLGSGGMAAVYVAHHKIGRRDAIKILHPEIAENKDLAARFEQEAHAVNRFRHPGAVSILDVDTTEDGAPFLVMELLEGESLEQRRKRGPIDPAEALRLADELLDVLAAAHASDIIHRDIKPDNLFVLPDGRLKVLDFGIARMRQGKSRTKFTAFGVTIGTLAYMPPEQVAGDAIDARADLFAVGCTMFEMASGRLPHEGSTEIELMVKMGMMPAPPLASVFPGADPGLCLVVDRALAFDKERRYPDALTMQADVRALRAGGAPRYATARLAAGDVPNPPESAGFRGPLTSSPAASMSLPSMPSIAMPHPAAHRGSLVGAPTSAVAHRGSNGVGAPPSAVEVAPVAVPTLSIRGNSRRDRVIAVIAVSATLLLCLAVVSWRVLRSSSDEPAADSAQAAGSAAPMASQQPSEDNNSPGGTALTEDGDPAAPDDTTGAPAAPTPVQQGLRPAVPPPPIPPRNAPLKPAPPASRGKKHRKH
jgi:eukaryotic-like serine/threonine-protein kinase